MDLSKYGIMTKRRKFENDIWVIGEINNNLFIGRTCILNDNESIAYIDSNNLSFKVILFNSDDITSLKKLNPENSLNNKTSKIENSKFLLKKNLILDVLKSERKN